MIEEKEQDFFETIVSHPATCHFAFGTGLLRSGARNPVAARWQRRSILFVRGGERPVRFRAGFGVMMLARDIGMLCNTDEFPRDVLGIKNEIHASRRNSTTRHRIVLSGIILRERNPALGLDGFQS